MEEVFNKLVDKAFILPLDTETKELLQRACEDYIKNIDIDKFENLILYFMYGTKYEDLYSHVKQSISNNSLKVKPTDLLCKSLSQYIVVATFEADTILESEKAAYSLALMNLMIGAKSKKVLFPFPESLHNGVNYYLNYYKTQAELKKPSDTKLIPQILDAVGIEVLDGVDLADCFEEIQYYCRKFARIQFEDSREVIKQTIHNINEPYAKAYYCAVKLANQDWTYIDQNPVKSLMDFEYSSSSKKKLSYIKEVVKQCQYYEAIEGSYSSSLLLNFLENSNSTLIDEEISMTPLEFAIALYYELVLEYSKDINV